MRHMYIDECKGSNGSFYMLVHIYGEKADIESFEQDITTINRNNPTLCGPNFDGIHAVDIKEKSKRKRGLLVEKWMDKFEDYIKNGRLNCFITVQSKQKKQNNSDYVKNIVSQFFKNPNALKRFSGIGELDEQSQNDILACIDQIWFLGARSDKINVHNSIVVHPDQIGKIIEDSIDNSWKAYKINNPHKLSFWHRFAFLRATFVYHLKKIFRRKEPQTYLISFGKALSFNSSLIVLLNTFLHPVRLYFAQNNRIRIERFEPLKDENSYTVQMCDIIGNYTYHSILAKKRDPSKNSLYKLNVLEKRYGIKQSLDDLSKNFVLNPKNELECTNNSYVMCIDLV